MRVKSPGETTVPIRGGTPKRKIQGGAVVTEGEKGQRGKGKGAIRLPAIAFDILNSGSSLAM